MSTEQPVVKVAVAKLDKVNKVLEKSAPKSAMKKADVRPQPSPPPAKAVESKGMKIFIF